MKKNFDTLKNSLFGNNDQPSEEPAGSFDEQEEKPVNILCKMIMDLYKEDPKKYAQIVNEANQYTDYHDDYRVYFDTDEKFRELVNMKYTDTHHYYSIIRRYENMMNRFLVLFDLGWVFHVNMPEPKESDLPSPMTIDDTIKKLDQQKNNPYCRQFSNWLIELKTYREILPNALKSAKKKKTKKKTGKKKEILGPPPPPPFEDAGI